MFFSPIMMVEPEGAGAGVGADVTVTVAELFAEPPVPEQVSVKVVFAVRFPVLCEPDAAFVPDHPPEAVHELALVEDQVSVDALPEMTETGLAEMLTVGAAGGGGVVAVPFACL
jgi:hypothetical protein